FGRQDRGAGPIGWDCRDGTGAGARSLGQPMLRGAIIGLGNVAVHAHLPGWQSRRDVAIVAATDADPARQSVCAGQLPQCRWYDTVDRLLDHGELDFVDVCTPPSSHAGLIRAALERGLHVLCEKPLASSPLHLPPLT